MDTECINRVFMLSKSQAAVKSPADLSQICGRMLLQCFKQNGTSAGMICMMLAGKLSLQTCFELLCGDLPSLHFGRALGRESQFSCSIRVHCCAFNDSSEAGAFLVCFRSAGRQAALEERGDVPGGDQHVALHGCHTEGLGSPKGRPEGPGRCGGGGDSV